jgi:hypothetical protein
MKRNRFSVMFILLAIMVWPAISFAGSTAGGNPWDDVVDQTPFTGTKFDGTLSIYFAATNNSQSTCTSTQGQETNAYFSVRLSKGFQLYAFQKMYPAICKNDMAVFKVKFIDFINASIYDIYAKYFDWRLKSVSNYRFNDETGSRSFFADFQLAVQDK